MAAEQQPWLLAWAFLHKDGRLCHAAPHLTGNSCSHEGKGVQIWANDCWFKQAALPPSSLRGTPDVDQSLSFAAEAPEKSPQPAMGALHVATFEGHLLMLWTQPIRLALWKEHTQATHLNLQSEGFSHLKR